MGGGILIDSWGNDRYEGENRRSHGMGTGHDLGLGMLVDRHGDDVYLGGEVVLGSSSHQGAGWFMDYEGDDLYEPVSSRSVAYVDGEKPSLFRTGVPGIAVFIDLDQPGHRFPAFIGKRQEKSGSHLFPPFGPPSSLGGGFTPPDTTTRGTP
jgi:hypothetical protein